MTPLGRRSPLPIGDDADPLSLLPASRDGDHERYDMASLLHTGDTRIDLGLRNNDFADNAFLAVFQLSASAAPATVPEPVSGALAGLGLLGMVASHLRRQR